MKMGGILCGSSLYISNESSIVKSFRNKKIRESFDGEYKTISRKFGISEIQVRNIVNTR
ncbi:Mor transcription activator family protein [Faecalimicrobium sp. JNUCC 81]